MAMQSGPQSEDSSRQVQSKTEQTPKPDKQDTVVNQLGEEDTVRELSLAGPSHTPNTLNVAFWKLYLTQAGEKTFAFSTQTSEIGKKLEARLRAKPDGQYQEPPKASEDKVLELTITDSEGLPIGKFHANQLLIKKRGDALYLAGVSKFSADTGELKSCTAEFVSSTKTGSPNLNPLAQDQPKPSASPRPQPKPEPASAVTIFKIDEKTEQALHNFFVSQLKRINKALGNSGRDVEVMMQKVTAQTDIKVYYKFEALLKDFEANPQASSDEPTTKYGDTVQAIMSGQRGTDDLRTFIGKLFSQQLSSGMMSLFDGKEQKLVKAFYAKLKESQGN